jgi:hypothetical protein
VAYNVNVLNTVHVDVDDLPTVDVSADVTGLPPVDVNSLPDLKITSVGPVGPVTLAGIPSSYTVGISNLPDVNVRIREIPSIRAHIPANFRLGFSVFGVELAALHLCGEAQIITEPFVPNPCERCGAPPRQVPPSTNPPGAVGAILRLANET